jgi:hypothetical protein
MIKMNDNLKRMLSSLAYQDAGENLSTHEKMKLLGIEAEAADATAPATLKMVKTPDSHRIVLISDGRGLGAPLDYAIETCSRLGANIDLLIHPTVDTADITALEGHIRSAGLKCQTIRLGTKPVDDILNYIHSQPAIASIVAMPDDEAAKQMMQTMASGRGESLPIPLVLIEDRTPAQSSKQSAA